GINQVGDIAKDGKVITLSDHIQQMKEKGLGSNKPAFSDMVDFVKTIADPNAKDQTKLSLAKYYFSPNNYNVLRQFEKEPDKNIDGIRGQYSVYHALTQPTISNAIWKLGDRETWSNYRGFVETS